MTDPTGMANPCRSELDRRQIAAVSGAYYFHPVTCTKTENHDGLHWDGDGSYWSNQWAENGSHAAPEGGE
jgi:hypothetical protein